MLKSFLSPPVKLSEINVTESLVSEDHTAEGFLVNTGTKIINFFRLDPGIGGHHVGNNGRVAMRFSTNDGDSWSDPSTIVDNQYDNRNVHGGITDDGRIVLFYRELNGSSHVDKYFIYSDDEGENWSDPVVLPSKSVICGTGKMGKAGDRYFMSAYATGFVEIMFSDDGSSWGDNVVIYDRSTMPGNYSVGETSIVYIGDGKMITMSRRQDSNPSGQHLQFTSDDYGKTWSSPSVSNVPFPYGRTPNDMFFDKKTNRIVCLTSDRQSSTDGGRRQDESIWIYAGRPDRVFDDAKKWTLLEKIKRPDGGMGIRFYGYPCHCKLDDDSYLVIFTDNDYSPDLTENANFYQFKLSIKNKFLL